MSLVVLADIAEHSALDLAVERAILGPDVDLVHCTGAMDNAVLVSACRDADAVITDLAPMTREVVGEFRRCRLISVAGTGYSNIDLPAVKDAEIGVCAISEYCTDEVADHIVLLILALARRLVVYQDQIQNEKTWGFRPHSDVVRLRGKTLGIIGFGKIGRAVARRARGFGMNLLAHTHHEPGSDLAEPGVRFCDLPELLDESDVISLNCNMSAESENFIDAAVFAQMRRNPIFINCARGELVDETALAEALDSGQISAAGIDVLRDESPDLESSPLPGRDNVILTPHMAFYSETSLLESRRISASNVRHFLDGRHDLVDKYVYRPDSEA